MKKLMLFILLIPLVSHSQIDSSAATITILLQARDCNVVSDIIDNSIPNAGFYDDIDSLLKSKYRPSFSAPTGATTVSISGIPVGVWQSIAYKFRSDIVINHGLANPFTRLNTLLRATNNVWLIDKMDKDDAVLDNSLANRVLRGGQRLRKEQRSIPIP